MSFRIFSRLVVTAVLAVCLSVSEGGQVQEKATRTIASVSSIEADSIVVSPDGTRVVWVQQISETKGRRVILDGKPFGLMYDQIASGTPIFSPDSKRIAFAAKKNNECFVIVDDKVSPPYPVDATSGGQWPIGSLIFSPDSMSVAYQAHKPDGASVVVNGKSYGPYDDVTLKDGKTIWGIWEFVFGTDSKCFAYRAKKDGKMLACAGRIRGGNTEFLTAGPFDAVGRGTPVYLPASSPGFAFIAKEGGKEKLVFLPKKGNPAAEYELIVRNSLVYDGSSVSYTIRRDNKSIPIIRGKTGPGYDDLGLIMIEGNRYAYAAAVGKQVCMVVDGKQGELYDGLRYPGTIFSPTGKRTAFAVRKGDNSGVCLDGKVAKWYKNINYRSMTFGQKDRQFAFIAHPEAGAKVVLNGDEGPSYEAILRLEFNADGSRFAYIARNGNIYWLVIDGKKLGPYDSIVDRTFTFSPSGKQYACVIVNKGRYYVLSDGKIGPECDKVVSQLVFNPTGTHLAYVVGNRVTGTRKWTYSVVCNRAVGKEFDAIWLPDNGNLIISDRGVVQYVGVENRTIKFWTATYVK